MFGLFKKKQPERVVEQELSAIANGEVVAIEDVADPVFSQKMMGDGYAIRPTTGAVFAPAAAEVVSIFPTKHAIALKLDNGLEVLLHMGVDTVELHGAGFDILVQEGDHVTKETQVATVDLEKLVAEEKPTDLIVILTNMDQVVDFTITQKGTVTAGTPVAKVVAN